MRSINEALAAQLMPQLDSEANKYTRGMCELVVGDCAYPGAGVLAAMAATRMGAGYVKVYTSAEAVRALHVLQPSAVASDFKQYALECHAQDDRHPSATAVGCGLRGTEENIALVKRVISVAAVPLLLDGGALSALATKEGSAALAEHKAAGFPTVITPHGGEPARLLKPLSDFRQEDASVSREADATRCSVAHDALRLARAYDVVCVLKGPRTYIAAPEDDLDDVRVFREGTPALAKAGTGDVLAGCVGALLAQGLSPIDASVLGVFIHGRAGVLAAKEIGEFGVTAEDVVRMLPRAARTLVG